MLRRSPLALKQPPLGKKGRQHCHDRAALGEGLALSRISFHVTYLVGLEWPSAKCRACVAAAEVLLG